MKKLFGILALMLSFVPITTFANDDTTHVLSPVVVTATRTPLEETSVNRTVDVIPPQVLQRQPSASVLDVLRMNSLIDVQARGINGVQGDMSMRGANFGQILMLFDGIRMNDPQTAHHDLDLPVPASGVSQIEIVPGSGSALYGPDAFGGVVNVIPMDGGPVQTSASLSMGEHNYQSMDLTTTQAVADDLAVNLAGAFKRSDGFHYDTDFEVGEAYAHAAWQYGAQNAMKATVAYAKKKFGAYDFYSGPNTDVPSQEETSTTFVELAAPAAFGNFSLDPKLYYRTHSDHFVYLITAPGLYVNDHKDYTDGGEAVGTLALNDNYVLLTGAEAAYDHLNSVGEGEIPSGLGTHATTRGAVYANLQRRRAAFTFDLGARADFYSTFGPQFDPTLSAGYLLTRTLRVYASAGRSFRAPSFTELYYSDPNNVGGDSLKPETAWSGELGARWLATDNVDFSADVFVRSEQNTIDFAQDSAGDPVSHAVNIPHSTVRGVELTAGLDYPQPLAGVLRQVRAGFTAMSATDDLDPAMVPRYTLLRPKQQLMAGADLALPARLTLTASAVYKLRVQGNAYTLLDAKLAKSFRLSGTALLTFAVEGTNLLNIYYEDIPGAPTPRRWMVLDAEVQL